MQKTIAHQLTIALLILCLTVTSCVGFTPNVFAETQDDIQQEETVTPGEEETPAPVTGWQDGFYYDSEGNLVVSTTLEISGVVYSFDASGASSLYTGVYNGYSYTSGKKLTGFYNSKYYKAGKLYSGIYKSYYYKKGVKVTKYKSKVKKMNNGKFYYFKKNGKVYTGTGWKRISGNRYYFKKGVAATGWNYIGSYKYYFHTKRATLCQDLIKCQGNKWKKKQYHIKVNRKKNCVTLYAKDGKNGYIIPVKAMACSVGLKDTPTITGTYTLTKSRTYRWWKLGGPTMGGYCWGQYCTRISGSYLFHSVTYAEKNKRTLSATAYNNLGKAASHGCVRLQVANAKIIYDIVNYQDAKVTIYDSDKNGPFDKPTVKKIPYSQNYDPTDPTI